MCIGWARGLGGEARRPDQHSHSNNEGRNNDDTNDSIITSNTNTNSNSIKNTSTNTVTILILIHPPTTSYSLVVTRAVTRGLSTEWVIPTPFH